MSFKEYPSYFPVFIFVLLGILAFLIIRPFILTLFMSLLLAYLCYPLYTYLQRKIPSKALSSLLVCVFVLLLLIIPGYFFVQSLVVEAYALFIAGKQRLAGGLLETCGAKICQSIQEFSSDPTVQFQIQEVLKHTTSWVIDKGSSFLASIPKAILNLFVMFFSLYYLLKDGDQLVVKIQSLASSTSSQFATLIMRIKELTQGIVFGYIVVAFIQGVLGAIGFVIFGISSPLFWGASMGLLALIPFLGTGVVWVPASLFMIVDGILLDMPILIVKGIALFLYGLIVISSIDNVLRPKLIGDKAKIHPAVIMLGIFGGILFFGPLGVIVGPFILSLLLVLLDVYFIGNSSH